MADVYGEKKSRTEGGGVSQNNEATHSSAIDLLDRVRCDNMIDGIYFLDPNLSIMAISNDLQSHSTLRVHFHHLVTDKDRRALVEALNLYGATISTCDGYPL